MLQTHKNGALQHHHRLSSVVIRHIQRQLPQNPLIKNHYMLADAHIFNDTNDDHNERPLEETILTVTYDSYVWDVS